jgi:citrate synthase
MPPQTLTIVDNRTGRRYEVPIEGNAIRAADLGRIKPSEEARGLAIYDPALSNTATCRSRVSFVDGERDVLRYRGYPIEQLAERSTFLETAYLIVKGELPTASHFRMWQRNITLHTLLHENVLRFIGAFRWDAHPMGILIGTVGALSTFYPDARDVLDLESRRVQTRRLIGKMPTLAAFAYRRSRGLPYVYPNNQLSYTGNLLSMMFRMTELEYRPDPLVERVLDQLFIVHADHEQNCSSTVMRAVGSAHSDPYSCVAAAAAALGGRRHGAANEDVIRMLQEIGSVDRVPAFVRQVRAGERPLLGFSQGLYRRYDPRTRIIKRLAAEFFDARGPSPLFDVARELERVVLDDPAFASPRLYPNVDLYSGLVYEAMGFPIAMFPVLFAIARTAGWMAHWAEMLLDEEQRLTRPQQLWVGPEERTYVPLEERPEGGPLEPEVRGAL